MHAFLITGSSQKERKQEIEKLLTTWGVASFDSYQIDVPEEKQSIGIADIRQFSADLSMPSRQSPYVVGIIYHAESMTVEAQNALLKTLEEPPGKVRIIIEAEQPFFLLPTIISRCQTQSLQTRTVVSSEEKTYVEKIMNSFENKKPGEILSLVDHVFDTKEKGKLFLNTYLSILHDLLTSVHNQPYDWYLKSRHIRAVIQAQKQLSANCNLHLIFDQLFLAILLDKR